jgi:hypothetical protein
LKVLLLTEVLPYAYFAVGDDATKHMYHYLGNTGRAYTIDLQDMIDDVELARDAYELELRQAKQFVETLPPGTHQITSRAATGGYNYKSDSWNWFFAIGGYSVWGKGVAQVSTPVGPYTNCRLDFELKFFDRYNWDGGKSVTIAGVTITDEAMGEFHRQGLAKEFDCVGSLKKTVTWQHTKAVAKPATGTNGAGGRPPAKGARSRA